MNGFLSMYVEFYVLSMSSVLQLPDPHDNDMACFRGGWTLNDIFFFCCIQAELLKHVEQTELLEYVELRLQAFKTPLTFILVYITGFKP